MHAHVLALRVSYYAVALHLCAIVVWPMPLSTIFYSPLFTISPSPGKGVFAQCYLVPLGEKGTTAGGNSRGGWHATEGPEGDGVESGVDGGEDWEQGVLRIIDVSDKVWDLTAVRDHRYRF
jgi:hypothetical protein